MSTGQLLTRIYLSVVLPDVVNVDRVFFRLEVMREHFFTGVVEFTFPRFSEEVDADAFGVQLTFVGAFLKTGVWNRFNYVTTQLVIYNRPDNAT